MTETFIVQNVAYIFASLCEGEWFPYPFSVLRKISCKLEKMETFHEKFFITSFADKNPERKKFNVTFSIKRRIHELRKINETMKPIFGLGHEI